MRRYFIWTILILLVVIFFVVGRVFGLFPLGIGSFGLSMVGGLILVWLYPREFFWLFLALLPLENIIISPNSIPISLRPFQVVGGLLLAVLFLNLLIKNSRINFSLLKPACFLCDIFKFKFCKPRQVRNYLNPLDRLVFMFGLASLVSVQFSPDTKMSLKLGIVLFSFIGLYWVTRNFVRNQKQILEAIWFFLVGTGPVILFGFYQALALKFGLASFQVMEKRVNSTFTEPDWLGMYLVFVIAILFGFKYVFNIIAKDEEGKLLQKIADIRIFKWSATKIGQCFLNLYLGAMIVILILTVARSAWLGGIAVFGVYALIILLKQGWGKAFREFMGILMVIIVSIGFLKLCGLTDFNLSNRATSSVSGLQEITVSCDKDTKLLSGGRISDIGELEEYDCRHINLEDIEKEKKKGMIVLKVFRPDPNIEIRKNIYKTTWQEIKKHWLFGQGLGSSSVFLGKDSLGHGLNASNIFLEVLFSVGVVGFLPFLLFVFMALIAGLKMLQFRAGKYSNKFDEFKAVFFLLTFFAILLPNLFNAGLFLGFFWVWLAIVNSSLIIKGEEV